MTPYGPNVVTTGDGGAEGAAPGVVVEVVEGFGDIELEYAAIRKHAAVLDQPNRAVIEVRGPDRVDFLNRMVTQELKGLSTGMLRRSFWLNKKGRIDADLRIIELGDRTLLELDVHALARTLAGLSSYVVMEDVELRDLTESTHRLALHGPEAAAALWLLAEDASTGAASLALPERDGAISMTLDGAPCIVFRDDTAGEAAYELIVPLEHARALYEKLLGFAESAAEPFAGRPRAKVRAIGWHAYNIARIEAGTPLYNIDFGTESLPAESGILHERVSFKKGCYLGQEIVARMHARKQVKQTLVAVRFEAVTDPATNAPRQPITGMTLHANPAVAATDAPAPPAIGVVTSSTVSPLLGSIPIAFAQVKAANAGAGTRVSCDVGGVSVGGEVIEGLAFWRRA